MLDGDRRRWMGTGAYRLTLATNAESIYKETARKRMGLTALFAVRVASRGLLADAE
jgi:hypothetical protein